MNIIGCPLYSTQCKQKRWVNFYSESQIPNDSSRSSHLQFEYWFAMMLSIYIMSAGVPDDSIKAYSTQTWRGLWDLIHCLLYGESPWPGNNSSQQWNSCEVRSLLWLLSLSASLLLSVWLHSLQITQALRIKVQTYKGQPFPLTVQGWICSPPEQWSLHEKSTSAERMLPERRATWRLVSTCM